MPGWCGTALCGASAAAETGGPDGATASRPIAGGVPCLRGRRILAGRCWPTAKARLRPGRASRKAGRGAFAGAARRAQTATGGGSAQAQALAKCAGILIHVQPERAVNKYQRTSQCRVRRVPRRQYSHVSATIASADAQIAQSSYPDFDHFLTRASEQRVPALLGPPPIPRPALSVEAVIKAGGLRLARRRRWASIAPGARRRKLARVRRRGGPVAPAHERVDPHLRRSARGSIPSETAVRRQARIATRWP